MGEEIHCPPPALTLLFMIALLGTVTGAPAADEPQTSPAPAPQQTQPTPPSDPIAASPAGQEESATPTEAGEVQERGVVRIPVPGIKSLDALGQRPTTAMPNDRYVAPTANLTMVANALRLRHKSLTTLITVDPNLPVTQPVEISIGYYSPAGNQRITQSYVRSSGNRFLYNDKEGDGKLRTMTISISLREPKAGGGYETFAVNWQTPLDPLYDVSIGPYTFDLISKCDAVGKSEIIFTWYSPDQQYHKFKFSTRAGSRTTITPFAWARPEVSWSHQLIREQAEFYDEDNAVTEMLWACLPAGCGFSVSGYSTNHLLTGTTQVVKGDLKARNDNCQAYFEYKMTKTLRLYPYL